MGLFLKFKTCFYFFCIYSPPKFRTGPSPPWNVLLRDELRKRCDYCEGIGGDERWKTTSWTWSVFGLNIYPTIGLVVILDDDSGSDDRVFKGCYSSYHKCIC
jgi:hypothetical protein